MNSACIPVSHGQLLAFWMNFRRRYQGCWFRVISLSWISHFWASEMCHLVYRALEEAKIEIDENWCRSIVFRGPQKISQSVIRCSKASSPCRIYFGREFATRTKIIITNAWSYISHFFFCFCYFDACYERYMGEEERSLLFHFAHAHSNSWKIKCRAAPLDAYTGLSRFSR